MTDNDNSICARNCSPQLVLSYIQAILWFLTFIASAVSLYYAYNAYIYSQMQFSYTIYNKYVEERARTNFGSTPTLHCYIALQELGAEDRTSILNYQPDGSYKLGVNSKDMLKKKCPNDSKSVKADKEIIKEIYNKLQYDIVVLDATLTGYKLGIGHLQIICENFSGYILSGIKAKGINRVGRGKFFWQMIMEKELREYNFPNLHAFLIDVRRESEDFEREIDCKNFRHKPTNLNELYALAFEAGATKREH